MKLHDPCHLAFDDLDGTGAVRDCATCRKPVHDFVDSTAEQIRVVRAREGQVCARWVGLPGKRVTTHPILRTAVAAVLMGSAGAALAADTDALDTAADTGVDTGGDTAIDTGDSDPVEIEHQAPPPTPVEVVSARVLQRLDAEPLPPTSPLTPGVRDRVEAVVGALASFWQSLPALDPVAALEALQPVEHDEVLLMGEITYEPEPEVAPTQEPEVQPAELTFELGDVAIAEPSDPPANAVLSDGLLVELEP